MKLNLEEVFESLKKTLDSYYPLSEETWLEYKNISKLRLIDKNDYAFNAGENINYITYVYKGLFRTVSINLQGAEYNKNFFWEDRFFGPIPDMLKKKETSSSVQALEDSIVIDINYKKYRELLYKYEDLKMLHILYLEKHWVVQKDDIAYSLVLEDAKERYERFLQDYGFLEKRIALFHIALFLGISPTHLSRIRKELNS